MSDVRKFHLFPYSRERVHMYAHTSTYSMKMSNCTFPCIQIYKSTYISPGSLDPNANYSYALYIPTYKFTYTHKHTYTHLHTCIYSSIIGSEVVQIVLTAALLCSTCPDIEHRLYKYIRNTSNQ